jgi:hypothetical protein
VSRRWPIAIFVAVFAFYLLTTGREPAWGDAEPMWAVADAIVTNQTVSMDVRWPEDLPPGPDGKTYAIAPLGTAIVHVPGAAIAHYAPGDQLPLIRPLATHLAPAALGALACVVFFGLLLELGVRPRIASACTAILALATTTWVYARYPYSEVLQLLCFTGTLRAQLRAITAPTRRNALSLGAWAGCLLNSKYVFALAIAGAAVHLFVAQRRVLLWAAAGFAPFVLVALAYNAARWGSPLATGYGPYLGAYFGGSVVDGAWGNLLSPTKSIFLFSPPLVLAVLGYRHTPRRYLTLLAATALPVFLVYCSYRSWAGDYAWGPRFTVPLVPALLVPLAFWLDTATTRARRTVIVLLVTAGIAVQLLGNALYWDHFIRIAIDTKNQWLGNANRSGAYVDERGRGHCDSCYEDTYPILWTPPFSQLRGHWWLVKSIARGDADDGLAAQDDAPWRDETTLRVDLSQTYHRARIDWWAMIWIDNDPETRTLGIAILILLVLATSGGVRMWIRLHRDMTSA